MGSSPRTRRTRTPSSTNYIDNVKVYTRREKTKFTFSEAPTKVESDKLVYRTKAAATPRLVGFWWEFRVPGPARSSHCVRIN